MSEQRVVTDEEARAWIKRAVYAETTLEAVREALADRSDPIGADRARARFMDTATVYEAEAKLRDMRLGLSMDERIEASRG
jgi:hypothetical protein